MSILELLWMISATLAAASVAILLTLIVARAVVDRLALIDDAYSGELMERLLADAEPGEPPPEVAADRRLVRVTAELVRRAATPEVRARILANAERFGVAQRLRADLRAWHVRRRATAASLLAGFDDPATVAALTSALDDRKARVRLPAALSLAILGRAPPASAMVERLGLGTTEHSQMMTPLFDEIAARHPEQLFELIARSGQASAVRRTAIDALAHVSDKRIAGVLIGLARDPEVDALDLAFYLEKLGHLDERSAVPVVIDGLAHPRPRVRSTAAQAVGKLGLEGEVSRLARLLDDPSWWVRFRTAEALVDLGEEGRKQLRAAAVRGTADARRTAAIALAEHGSAA